MDMFIYVLSQFGILQPIQYFITAVIVLSILYFFLGKR